MREEKISANLKNVKIATEKLGALLCLREEKFLFQTTRKYNLPMPGNWTDDEISAVQKAYYSESDNDRYYLQVLQDWEDGQYEFSDDEPEDEEALEIREHQKQWMEHCLKTGRKLREIRERKSEFAEVLAKELLRPERVRRLLVDMETPVITFMRDIWAGHLHRDAEGFYPIACSPGQKNLWSSLEEYGYAIIRRTDPYDEEDDREHYTGIALTDDTLPAMKNEDTAKMESDRNQRYMMNSLELIIQDYYELVPLWMVSTLYNILRQQDPDRYPEMNQEELLGVFDRKLRECPGSLFGPVTYRGKKYIRNLTGEELTDEMTGENSYEASLIETWEEGTEEPYIPSLEELQNFLQYGYWEARKPYRELRQFVKECYLDEQSIEEMGGRFMRLTMDAEEWDKYDRKRHYSIDMVEERTDEKFNELFAYLNGGNDAGEIYRQDKDFTCSLSNSAKRKYRRLLTSCAKCTPRPWNLGKSDGQLAENQGSSAR